MSDAAQFYIGILTLIAIVVAPVSVAASVFLWSVHAEDRRLDARTPLPLLRLSLVMAISSTIASIASVYIGGLAILRISGVVVPAWTGPITATVFVALDMIPILNAAYLRWLRRKRARIEGVARPPPWAKED